MQKKFHTKCEEPQVIHCQAKVEGKIMFTGYAGSSLLYTLCPQTEQGCALIWKVALNSFLMVCENLALFKTGISLYH